MIVFLIPIALADAPRARVLDDKLEAHFGADGAVRETRTWKVQVDTPDPCPAGCWVPDGLDGASDKGATVVSGVLHVPPGLPAGAVLTLTGSRTSSRLRSGGFDTRADLPVQRASVRIEGPAPITVWTDGTAAMTFAQKELRTARASWSDAGEARLAWSAWRSWDEAGAALEAQVKPKLATKDSLGRVLGANLAGLTPPVAAYRVWQEITLVDGPSDWSTARPASAVIGTRSGTAAERGLVLLSMLRLAGNDARPALYRPGGADMPWTVAAPALMPKPVIAVKRGDNTIWIDPADPWVAIPELPSGLRGGVAWMPGELPEVFPATDEVDGEIIVTGRIVVAPDGSATWSASLSASGTAPEHLRRWLGPLPDAARNDALRQLLVVGHPGTDRFTLDGTGLQDPRNDLRVTLQGHEPVFLTPLGKAGYEGKLVPLLAPALAARMPNRVLVREEMVIQTPSGLNPVVVAEPESTVASDALLSRTVRRNPMVMVTEATRPEADRSHSSADNAISWLREEARTGPSVVLLPPAGSERFSEVKSIPGKSPCERAILEALAWYDLDAEAKAGGLLGKARKADKLEFAELLPRQAGQDARPFVWWFEESDDPREKLQAISGLERRGFSDDARRLLAKMESAPDPWVLVDVVLAEDRLAPPGSDAAALDARLGEIDKMVRMTVPEGDPRVILRRAARAIDVGRNADAEVMLEAFLEKSKDPLALVLLAEAQAAGGLPSRDVQRRVDEAVDLAPADAAIYERASRVATRIGRREEALRDALLSARLAQVNADRWAAVIDPALAEGRLGVALRAGLRSLNYRSNAAVATRVALLATLAGDQLALQTALKHNGKRPEAPWPPPLASLTALAGESGLRALLEHHDAEVEQSASWLGLRGGLRYQDGDLEGAVRDGLTMFRRYGDASGVGLAFSASAGRVSSTSLSDDLDRAAVKNPKAAEIRLEYHLVSGVGDAAKEAKAKTDDPRAEAMLAPDPNWPRDLVDPVGPAPAGFRANPVLGAAPGVVAWSDPQRAIALVRTSRISGTLPPPLSALYSIDPRPVRSLEGGVQVVRLVGGPMAIYAAAKITDGQQIWGLGFTPGAAEAAQEAARQ